MKTIANGKEVTSRTLYYLLDWRDRHHDERPLIVMFNKERLSDLTIDEYIFLFRYATEMDVKELESSK